MKTEWIYAGIGIVLLAGLGVGLVALDDSDPDSAASPSGPQSAEPPAGAIPQNQSQEFPGEYDTLGIVLGSEDAPLVIREFADYQCPACRSFFPSSQRIRDEYVEEGEVRFVFFDLPIRSQHPNAMAAAQAARCAGRQDAYWAMHDLLFEHQPEWSPEPDPVDRFGSYADTIGIDAEALETCVRDEETRGEVEASLAFAEALGVPSTPTVVVGNVPVVGVRPWPDLEELIEQSLAGDENGSDEG